MSLSIDEINKMAPTRRFENVQFMEKKITAYLKFLIKI